MGLQGMTFEELFVGHCANHANFIEPAYQVLEEGRPVPYSLGKTRTVCSACLEFYNIIGSSFQKKYVVPCPGAVLFCRPGPQSLLRGGLPLRMAARRLLIIPAGGKKSMDRASGYQHNCKP